MDDNIRIEDWEFAYRQRASSSPQAISLDYAVALTVTLFKFRDLMKELPEEFRDDFAEVDDDYNDLVTEASKSFYKLGWHDALKQQQVTPEGDR